MATTKKVNTAMVYNPSRALIGAKSPVKKNPVKKTVATRGMKAKVVNASSHRRKRRRSNPSELMGLVGAALMVGVGVTIFDVLTTKFLPQTSPYIRIGTKLGGAFLAQTMMNSGTPLIGKYKNEIALVLAVSAVVDLLQWLVVPQITGFAGNLLGTATGTVSAIPADELGDDEYYVIEEDDDDEDY